MTANTPEPFHIVYKPDDWEEHDSNNRTLALDYLATTTHSVELRELEAAAQRFHPSDELRNAINAALAARAPLLLTGEPGTGKTQVAWFLKRFFGIELFEYQVRSNSQASDLRYEFDAVAYLRDAYVEQHKIATDNTEQQGTANDPRAHPKYLKPGPLWQAYSLENAEKILLIDEIDKASRDFPNDLLQELDQHRFAHPFHPKQFIERKGAPPIIVITSNGERRLPDAFLRRCIVHHIKLDDQLLQDIMQAWEFQFNLDAATRTIALQRFQEIRSINRLSKKPGAAELLLWLTVLSAQQVSEQQLNQQVALKDLPGLVCLIKDHADYGLLS